MGQASDYIAGRDNIDSPAPDLRSVLTRLENIEAKIAHTSNNIVINSCPPNNNLKNSCSIMTQTELTCDCPVDNPYSDRPAASLVSSCQGNSPSPSTQL